MVTCEKYNNISHLEVHMPRKQSMYTLMSQMLSTRVCKVNWTGMAEGGHLKTIYFLDNPLKTMQNSARIS